MRSNSAACNGNSAEGEETKRQVPDGSISQWPCGVWVPSDLTGLRRGSIAPPAAVCCRVLRWLLRGLICRRIRLQLQTGAIRARHVKASDVLARVDSCWAAMNADKMLQSYVALYRPLNDTLLSMTESGKPRECAEGSFFCLGSLVTGKYSKKRCPRHEIFLVRTPPCSDPGGLGNKKMEPKYQDYNNNNDNKTRRKGKGRERKKQSPGSRRRRSRGANAFRGPRPHETRLEAKLLDWVYIIDPDNSYNDM